MELPILSSNPFKPSSSSSPPSESITRVSPSTFPPRRSINLISTLLNARIHSCSDEFFAPASSLLLPHPPVHKPGVYIHTGKWYDGWETRRHNRCDFDWVVVELGVSAAAVAAAEGEGGGGGGGGVVFKGVEIDTAFFNGNHAPEVAVEAGVFADGEVERYVAEGDEAGRRAARMGGSGGAAGVAGGVEEKREGEGNGEGRRRWATILPRQECGPSQPHAWLLPSTSTKPTRYTHIRLLMYPDGGIARFRLYGNVHPVLLPLSSSPPSKSTAQPTATTIDLASALNGGLIESSSDAHFGPASNLLLPGRGMDMRDGWETKRSRGGDHTDWVIVRLAAPGYVQRVVVDTKDFRGNFPRAVRVLAGSFDGVRQGEEDSWTDLLGGVRECEADREHVFDVGVDDGVQGTDVKERIWSHVQLVILPDGGVKRLRVFGVPAGK